MQKLVGAQTGTAVHQWTHKDMDILPNRSDPTQLDCIDEAVNTWTYMTMMERSKLFRFHRVAQLSNAGTLTDPRNTAVLQETGGGYFALTSTSDVPATFSRVAAPTTTNRPPNSISRSQSTDA